MNWTFDLTVITKFKAYLLRVTLCHGNESYNVLFCCSLVKAHDVPVATAGPVCAIFGGKVLYLTLRVRQEGYKESSLHIPFLEKKGLHNLFSLVLQMMETDKEIDFL